MPYLDAQIDFEVYCDECGEGLCKETRVEKGTKIYVNPCPSCMNKSNLEGYDEARAKFEQPEE